MSDSESAGEAAPSIDVLLNEFLAEQEKRLAPRTFANYVTVTYLLRDCLNGYGYQSLSAADLTRWESAAERGDEDAFVVLFGADKIAENLGEFLGYFMVRKVMAGEELLRASGTVTKKLTKWLGQRGYLDASTMEVAVERSGDAARDLPKAEKLSRLLFEQSQKSTLDTAELDEDHCVDDYLMIERVESGVLWFEGGIGPVNVPKDASDIAQPGWSVNVVLARGSGSWQIVEVGNVYP